MCCEDKLGITGFQINDILLEIHGFDKIVEQVRLALKRNNHFENENISLINDVKEADQETIYDKVDIEALMKDADLTQFYDKLKEEKLD